MENPWRDADTLERLYWDEGLSMEAISDELGCAYRTVWTWMDKHDIERRPQWQEMDGPWRDEETLRQLYVDENLSALEIANMFDCHKKTIYNWLNRHGIDIRPSTHDIDHGWRDAELIRELYDEHGMTDRQIAERLGTQEGTVTKWRNRHGIDADDYSGDNHHLWRGGHIDYKGANWLQQRRKARRRDQYRCQNCGKTAAEMDTQPDVHHIKPYQTFDDYQEANRLENLITLCKSCHISAEHKIGTIHGN